MLLPVEVGPDDDIAAFLVSDNTNLITLVMRFEGQRKPVSETLSHSAGDRSEEIISVPIQAGKLIDLSMSIAGPVEKGQTFINLSLRSFGRAHTRLCRGYLYDRGRMAIGDNEDPLSGKGRKVDNEAASTLVNNTELIRTITVPTNVRWELVGGQAFNADDVTRALFVDLDNGAQIFYRYHGGNVGASAREVYPSQNSHAEHGLASPFPLSEADRILITFSAGGSSAGGTARSSAVVREWIEI